MITQDLLAYIKAQLALGKDPAEIRHMLETAGGWKSDDVTEGFQLIDKQNIPTAAPVPVVAPEPIVLQPLEPVATPVTEPVAAPITPLTTLAKQVEEQLAHVIEPVQTIAPAPAPAPAPAEASAVTQAVVVEPAEITAPFTSIVQPESQILVVESAPVIDVEQPSVIPLISHIEPAHSISPMIYPDAAVDHVVQPIVVQPTHEIEISAPEPIIVQPVMQPQPIQTAYQVPVAMAVDRGNYGWFGFVGIALCAVGAYAGYSLPVTGVNAAIVTIGFSILLFVVLHSVATLFKAAYATVPRTVCIVGYAMFMSAVTGATALHANKNGIFALVAIISVISYFVLLKRIYKLHTGKAAGIFFGSALMWGAIVAAILYGIGIIAV